MNFQNTQSGFLLFQRFTKSLFSITYDVLEETTLFAKIFFNITFSCQKRKVPFNIFFFGKLFVNSAFLEKKNNLLLTQFD